MATTAETEEIRPGRLALSVGDPELPSPEGWKWVKLREIARMATGHTPSRSNSDYWGGDIPWIKAKDARPADGGIINDSDEYTNEKGISNSSAVVLPRGTVCLSRTGSIGYSVILGRPMATSQGFVNWVCSDAIVPRFLQALFILERPFLEEIAEGSAHETVYLSEAKAFHVCLPPIEEQRRIANRLDAIQSRTEKTGEILDQVPDRIEEYRHSVLNAAFTGRLTADWREDNPDVEPAEELLERILNERREQWEEDYRAKYEKKGKEPPSGWKSRYTEASEPDVPEYLPELPNLWIWVCLDQLLREDVRNGRSVRTQEGGFPVLRLDSIERGYINTVYHKEGEWTREEAEKFIIQEGDFYVSRGNGTLELVGRGGLVPPDPMEVAFPDTMMRVRVNTDRFDPHFLRLVWDSHIVRRHLENKARTSAGIYKINQGHLKSTVLPLPPEGEQKGIVRRVRQRLDKIDEMARHVEQAGERLDHLDRSVLAKAFRGELVETEAERARREGRDYETAEELLERERGESSSEDQSSSSQEQSSTTTQVDENGQFEMKVVKDDPDL